MHPLRSIALAVLVAACSGTPSPGDSSGGSGGSAGIGDAGSGGSGGLAGSGGSGGVGESPYACGLPAADPSSACPLDPEVFCDLEVACGWWSPDQLDICLEDARAVCARMDIPGKIAVGRVAFDGEAFACCWADIARNAACRDLSLTRILDTPACDHAIMGTVPPGQPCATHEDCASGTCVISNSMCPGECVGWPAFGEPCVGLGDCAEGLSCSQHGICVHRAGPGDACADDSQATCDPAFVCGASGTCIARPKLGENCTTDAQESWYCDGRTACVDGTCGERLGEGAPCLDIGLQCQADLYCKAGSDHRGTCERGLAEGEACDDSLCVLNGVNCRLCQSGLWCKAGTCTSKWPAMGEPCADAVCAEGLACVNGTCGPLRPEGMSCYWNSDCVSDDCYGRVCWPKCD